MPFWFSVGHCWIVIMPFCFELTIIQVENVQREFNVNSCKNESNTLVNFSTLQFVILILKGNKCHVYAHSMFLSGYPQSIKWKLFQHNIMCWQEGLCSFINLWWKVFVFSWNVKKIIIWKLDHTILKIYNDSHIFSPLKYSLKILKYGIQFMWLVKSSIWSHQL